MQKLQEVDFAPRVNWDEVDILEGSIVENKLVTIGDLERKVIVLQSEDGFRYSVWQSVSLEPMFMLPVGTFVRIEYKGWETNPRTKRRFRKFLITFDPQTSKVPF
jgi:hypothetical protein